MGRDLDKEDLFEGVQFPSSTKTLKKDFKKVIVKAKLSN